MPSKKSYNLAICIPTHHGRALYLRELLDSILRQSKIDGSLIQICISDNASQDGTSAMVESYQKNSHIPIEYFRFSVDTGIRNFFNVISMADAEYCWLMGSDDVILDGGVYHVLEALKNNPDIPALSVNKLNFDKSLKIFVGPDHSIVLPSDPKQTHAISGFECIMKDLGMAFGYISAHVFRQDDWDAVVQRVGVDYLVGLRHFPHLYIFSQIAKEYEGWLWIAEYCVIQRLENFCVMEEVRYRKSQYAVQYTEDMERIFCLVLHQESAAYLFLMKKLFILYWGPWFLMIYKSEPDCAWKDELAMLSQCVGWFRKIPLFWVTSCFVLMLPSFFVRPLKRLFDYIYKLLVAKKGLAPLRNAGRKLLHYILNLMGIEKNREELYDSAKQVVERYLDSR